MHAEEHHSANRHGAPWPDQPCPRSAALGLHQELVIASAGISHAASTCDANIDAHSTTGQTHLRINRRQVLLWSSLPRHKVDRQRSSRGCALTPHVTQLLGGSGGGGRASGLQDVSRLAHVHLKLRTRSIKKRSALGRVTRHTTPPCSMCRLLQPAAEVQASACQQR